MKRELKFRVWEKGTPNLLGYEHFNTCLNNGFMYVNLSELKEGEDEGDLTCHSEFHNPPMLRPNGFNGLFREQFTGLTDKNGVDIYEGDILDHYDGNIIVKYESDYCGFNICYSLHECIVMNDNITVIGNIHENPELL